MKSIQIINVRWFNATAWYGAYIARLLQHAGHQTLVLGLANTESFDKAQAWGLSPRALKLNTNSPWGIIQLFFQLKKIIKEFQPDIVNCHRGEAFVLLGILRKMFEGTPYAFGLVRTRGDQRLPKNNLPNRYLHQKVADALIATNSVMTRHFTEKLGVPAQKIHCLLGGVDREKFAFTAAGRTAVRQEFGYTEKNCVVGLLGRFDLVKGQKETIEAVSYLYHKKDLRNIRLCLLGFHSATPQSTVEEWIRAANIEEITQISGKRQDVASCISALDVGVISSLWSETIARAALEIMSCGRALISTNVGVMPDLLPQEALFAPNDVPALAEKLAEAVQDAAWRKKLEAHSAERMQDLGGEDFLAQTLAVYAAVAPKR